MAKTECENDEYNLRFSEYDDVNSILSDFMAFHDIIGEDRIRKLDDCFPSLIRKTKNFLDIQARQRKELISIGTALSAEKNLNKLLEKIVHESMNFTNADGGTLYIRTDDEKHIAFKILRNRSMKLSMGGTSPAQVKFPPLALYKENGDRNDHNVSVYVALTGKTINIHDVYESAEFNFDGPRMFDQKNNYRTKSMIVAALRNHENEIIGVLQLINAMNDKKELVTFSEENQDILESMASLAAVAITNAMLITGLENLLDSFIKAIASAIDEKSPYTAGHIRRVAELTTDIAKAMSDSDDGSWRDFKLSKQEEDELRIAAWMHDVGKITTPEYVVDKSTKLETVHDRIHTVVTRFEVLRRDAEIEFLRKSAELVLAGHKHSDDVVQELEQRYTSLVSELDDDLRFIMTTNIGGEFMEDGKIERLKKIASRKLTINGMSEPLLSDDEVTNLSIRRGTLTEREREIIQNHVVLTARMLEQLPWPKHLRRVAEYAASHHEKLNCTGYPNGLCKSQLAVQSRIMAIADIFEALSASDRPYKKGKTISECVKILSFMIKDGHIDKDIVDFFIESGLLQDYARRELKDYQLDAFTYNGVQYDFNGVESKGGSIRDTINVNTTNMEV